MGAWGNRSWDCDDVMDEVDGFTHRLEFNTVNEMLDHVLKDKSGHQYNPTLLVGCVMYCLKHKIAVPNRFLPKAIKQACDALKDKDYIANWKNPAKRRAVLHREITCMTRKLFS